MINPAECFAAPVGAAKRLTLVLPRTEYEYRSLIVTTGERPVLFCLDDYPNLGRFLAFECQANESWKGLHIPDVRIELDETSLHDADRTFVPLGAMVRFEDKLILRANFEGHAPPANGSVILSGLPACTTDQRAYFLKWQIVLGEGSETRVLAKVNVTPNAS